MENLREDIISVMAKEKLEAYVKGDLSLEEQFLFERMISIYPVLNDYVLEYEKKLLAEESQIKEVDYYEAQKIKQIAQIFDIGDGIKSQKPNVVKKITAYISIAASVLLAMVLFYTIENNRKKQKQQDIVLMEFIKDKEKRNKEISKLAASIEKRDKKSIAYEQDIKKMNRLLINSDESYQILLKKYSRLGNNKEELQKALLQLQQEHTTLKAKFFKIEKELEEEKRKNAQLLKEKRLNLQYIDSLENKLGEWIINYNNQNDESGKVAKQRIKDLIDAGDSFAELAKKTSRGFNARRKWRLYQLCASYYKQAMDVYQKNKRFALTFYSGYGWEDIVAKAKNIKARIPSKILKSGKVVFPDKLMKIK